MRQSGRSHTGAHVAAHARNSHADGTRRLPLANSKATLGREPAVGIYRRVAGIAVGFVTLRGLLLLLPEHFLPVASVPLDSRALGFTLLISLLTSVLFGMLPALATRTFDLRSAIVSRAATGGDRLRVRQALIAGEVALTVVLLAASGLLIRTLIHLQTLPAGFNAAGVMTARVSLDDVRYHDAAAFRKLLDDAPRRCGDSSVEDAAVGLSLPYESLEYGVNSATAKRLDGG